MQKSSRLLGIFGCAALLCLTQIQPIFADAPAMATINFGIAYVEAEVSPFFVARDKGYFREENLDVNMFPLMSGDKIAYALVSGSVDVAAYTPDWFIRADEKGDAGLKIVIGGSNVPDYSLVAPNAVQSYADLKGKRIGVSTLKASDAYIIKRMLGAGGLREGDFDLIQTGSSPDRAAALKAGSISATLLSTPIDELLIDDGGFKRLDSSARTLAHYAWKDHAVRGDWARANKAKLVAFTRGWIRATRWMFDPNNKEEAIGMLARELKTSDRYARISYELSFGSKANVARDGAIDPLGLREMIDAMALQGDVGQPAPKVEKFIDASYWEEAVKSLK